MSNNATPIQPAPVTIPANLTPFQFYCATTFPYIEADFDALTNYQLMCKIVNYLNQVIADVNQTNEGLSTINDNVKKLYDAYTLFEQNISEQVNQLSTEVATIQEDVTEFEDDITEKFNNMSSEFNELKQSITAFENNVNQKLADMTTSISGISEKTSEIETNLTNLTNNFNSLSETVSNMASGIATQEAELRRVKQTAETNSTNITSLQQTTSGLATSITEQEASIKQLDEKADNNTEKITTEVARLDKRIDDLGGGGGGTTTATAYQDKYYTAFVYGFWLDENMESGIYEPSISNTAGYTVPIAAANGDSFTIKVSEKTAIRAVLYNLQTDEVNTTPAKVFDSSSNLTPDEYVDTYTFTIDVECTSLRIGFYDKIQNNPDIQIFKNNELLPFFYVNLNNYIDSMLYNREANPTYPVSGLPNIRYKDFVYNAEINTSGDIVPQTGYMVTCPINIYKRGLTSIDINYSGYGRFIFMVIDTNNVITTSEYYYGGNISHTLTLPNTYSLLKISMPIADNIPDITLHYGDSDPVKKPVFELSFEHPTDLLTLTGDINLPEGTFDFGTIYYSENITLTGNNTIIKGIFHSNPLNVELFVPTLIINNCKIDCAYKNNLINSRFHIDKIELNNVEVFNIRHNVFTVESSIRPFTAIFNSVTFKYSEYNMDSIDKSTIFMASNAGFMNNVYINNCNYISSNFSAEGQYGLLGIVYSPINLYVANSNFTINKQHTFHINTGKALEILEKTHITFLNNIFTSLFESDIPIAAIYGVFLYEAHSFLFTGNVCNHYVGLYFGASGATTNGYATNNNLYYDTEYDNWGDNQNAHVYFNTIHTRTTSDLPRVNTTLGSLQTNQIIADI